MSSFSSSTVASYTKVWLIGVGILELLLAGAFVAGAIAVPVAAFGFYLTAVLLGLTGLVLVLIGIAAGRRAKEANRIATTGIAGTGTVTGLTQTGMFLNNNPQIGIDLTVAIPGQPAYQAQRKEFVPLVMLGRLAVGGTLPVKVDPLDHSKVIIEWSGQTPAASGGWASGGTPPGARPGGQDESMAQIAAAMQGSGLSAAQPYSDPGTAGVTVDQIRAHLRATGLQGTATIDKLEDAGQTVGDERMFAMQATVNVPGQAAYISPMSAAMVPAAFAHKVRVGAVVPVRVAANNPNAIMFEWDKL